MAGKLKKKEEPWGVVRGLEDLEYFARPALSSGGTKCLLRSPAHYWAQHLDPNREQKVTPAPILGSAIHTVVLEPDTWKDRYLVAPENMDRRSKAGKDTWKALSEDAEDSGKVVLKWEEAETALKVQAAVRAHPLAVALFSEGEAESSVFWKDPETQATCKARPDWMRQDGVMVDLKSCISSHPETFSKQAFNLGYYIQAAWYSAGWQVATGQEVTAFMFVAVEKTPPYGVSVFDVGPEYLELGRVATRKALDLYVDCQRTGQWPGYPRDIQTLEAPPWALKSKEQNK